MSGFTKYLKIIFLFSILLIRPDYTQAETTVPDILLYRPVDDELLDYKSMPWTEGCDTVYHWKVALPFYYNSDSLFHLIATRDFSEIIEEVWYYYFLMDGALPPDKISSEKEKLQKAAKKYKSKALDTELDLFELYSWNISYPLTEEKWFYFWSLVEKYDRKGDLQTKLRILQRLIYGCSGIPTYLVSSRLENERVPVIRVINETLSTLERLGDEPYLFEPGYIQSQIGVVYYDFGFYEKAVPLFEKVLSQPDSHIYDRGKMRARDYLGSYYSMTGDYDRSDSLYLSILQSEEKVVWRPTDEVIAIGALARNAWYRGNEDEAIHLYSVAMPRAMEVGDSTLAGGYAVSLGQLFLHKGSLTQTRDMIDRARKLLVAGKLPLRNWEGYYILCRDYSLISDRADLAAAYIDSVASVRSSAEATYNARIIAYAEQEAFEMEKALKEEQIQKHRLSLKFALVTLFLSILAIGVLIYSYQKKLQKNRALFRQIKEQDRLAAELVEISSHYCPKEIVSSDQIGEKYQFQLFSKLQEYLLTDRNFSRTEIDSGELANILFTNRTYLFEAVKAVTGKTLQEYINTLRLEEAKQMLETTDELIETIAALCGYNSVRTFYRLFKTRYNLSPAVYRKMAKRQTPDSASF